MERQIIHWQESDLRGPELLSRLPSIVPEALHGTIPLTATVMTLGIYLEQADPSTWQRFAEDIAATHPARILILSPAPEDGADDRLDVDVHVAIDHQRGPGVPPLLYSECLFMRLRGNIANYWIDWLQPLVRSDLPSYLWWNAPPPRGRFRWDLLSTTFSSLIIDSGSYPLRDWENLISAADRYQMGLMDLDWTRGASFRYLLSEAADHEGVLHVLENPDGVQVTYPHTGQWPLASSWLWLSGKLGWPKRGIPPAGTIPFLVQDVDGPGLSWTFTRGSDRIVVSHNAAWHLQFFHHDSLVRQWQEPQRNATLIDDIRHLLSRGRAPLYRETLKNCDFERNDR